MTEPWPISDCSCAVALGARGPGVAVDWSWRRSAGRGNATAMTNPGSGDEKGQGVAADAELAISRYLMAADCGNAIAMNNLARM